MTASLRSVGRRLGDILSSAAFVHPCTSHSQEGTRKRACAGRHAQAGRQSAESRIRSGLVRPSCEAFLALTVLRMPSRCALYSRQPGLLPQQPLLIGGEMTLAPIHSRRDLLALLCVLALASAPARAQSEADFSGTWTRVDDESERPSVATAGDLPFRAGTAGSGWGSPLTIRHDAKTLVVEYAHFSAYDLQPPISFTYSMDGSESHNTLMIGHTESTQRSRTEWRDDRLVITTVLEVPGLASIPRVEVRQVLRLESPQTLIIETTRTAVAGASPSVTRTVYRRSGA